MKQDRRVDHSTVDNRGNRPVLVCVRNPLSSTVRESSRPSIRLLSNWSTDPIEFRTDDPPAKAFRLTLDIAERI